MSSQPSISVGSPANRRTRSRSNSLGSVTNQSSGSDKSKVTKAQLSQCPCQKSDLNSYKIKCCQCKQQWHTPCANISSKSLPDKCVIEMEKCWTCPWCYVCPFMRPIKHPSTTTESKLLGTVVSTSVQEKLVETFDSKIEEVEEAVNKALSEHLETFSIKMADELEKLNTLRDELMNKPANSQGAQEGVPATVRFKPSETHHRNPTKHVEGYVENFLSPDDEGTTNLIEAVGKLKFTKVKGREVASFGQEYKYSGAPKSNTNEIPSQLKWLIDKVKGVNGNSNEIINQVIVNKYSGQESYLPEHSDNETTIKPESNIFTISLGATRTVMFKDKSSGNTHELAVDNNSLYVMSQGSQMYWTHKIDKESSDLTTRYSITLRTVGGNFKNSTVIIGDSNTKHLKFSEGKPKEIGTFGYMVPGKRVEAFHLREIDPEMCVGYRNVILHCGINDIRDKSPGRIPSDPDPSDVEEHFNTLITKIREIKELCPYASITVSPILPTKSLKLNQRVVTFNKYLMMYITDDDASEGVRILNLEGFVNENGVLIENLGVYDTRSNCYNKKDILHLGKTGIRMLAKLFRESILYKFSTNRTYSNVVASTYNQSGVPPAS